MKNFITLLACCLLVSAKIYAQPVLNPSCGFQDGSLIHIYSKLAPALNEGNSGMNQTWDFSSLIDDLEATDYTGTSVSLTPYGNEFPMANVASSSVDLSGNDVYSYFTDDDTHYSTWGYESSDGTKLIYSDARDILHFPFTYGDSFTDSYFASLLVGYNSGTVEISADAYGTVILPSGTFNNCLRVREVRMDTLADSPTPTYSNDTSYKFYAVNYAEPLCQVNHHHSSDGFNLDEIYWQNVSPTAVALLSDDHTLSVYPNPCSDLLTVTIPSSENNFIVSIQDASGRSVTANTQLVNQSLQINTTSLPEGIYLLNLHKKDKHWVKAFLVNRD